MNNNKLTLESTCEMCIIIPLYASQGAIAGLLCGFAQQFWFGFGSMIYGPKSQSLPRSIDGCDAGNNTSMVYNTTQSTEYNIISTTPTFNSSIEWTDNER